MKSIIIASALAAFASGASATEWTLPQTHYTSESMAFSCAAVYHVAADKLFDMKHVEDAKAMALTALQLYINTNAPTDGFEEYQNLRRAYLNAPDNDALWVSVRMCDKLAAEKAL